MQLKVCQVVFYVPLCRVSQWWYHATRLQHRGGGVKLRDMIMGIQSENKKRLGNIYHTIGQNSKGRYTFKFIQSKATEASMIADDIILYILKEYDDKVIQLFDPEVLVEKSE